MLLLAILGLVVAKFRLGSVREEGARWYLAAALVAIDQNQPERALRRLQQAAGWNPEDPEIYVTRAEVQQSLGDLEAALKSCQTAIDVAPNAPNGYMARCEIHSAVGQHGLGLPDCDQLVRLFEEQEIRSYYTAKHGYVGLFPYNNRAYRKALANEAIESGLKDVEKSIQLFGNLSSLLDTRGFLHYRGGDYDRAVEDLNRAISDERLWYTALAERAVESGDAASRERLEATRHGLAVMYYHRSLVWQAMGKTEQAQQDRQQVYELGEEDPESLY